MNTVRKPRTLQDIRTAELSQIHIAKKQLGWTEDEYRAVIGRVSKGATDSAGELNHKQRAELLWYMKSCGFKVRHARKTTDGKRRTPSVPITDRTDQVRMMRALWLRLHAVGAIENADEQGLITFVNKHTEKNALQWLTVEECQRMIEILKKWFARVRVKPFVPLFKELHKLGVVNACSINYILSTILKSYKVDLLDCTTDEYTQTLDGLQQFVNKQGG